MPAPFATPSTVNERPPISPRACTTLAPRSVVRIACENVSAFSESDPTRAGTWPVTFASSSTTPMTPVEAGSTSSSRAPRALATAAVVTRAATAPASPVHAFAHPLFTRMAFARPFAIRAAAISTGAARTRLVVKTAPADATSSATASARSRRPSFFSPQVAPEKRKPGTTASVCSMRRLTPALYSFAARLTCSAEDQRDRRPDGLKPVLLAELNLAPREPRRRIEPAARQSEARDDVDEVVPAQEHRRDDDVRGEEADEGPGVLEGNRVAVVERVERKEHRPRSVEGGEDVFLRAARLHGVQDGVEPDAGGQLVLVAVGEVANRAVAGNDHVEGMRHRVDEDHAEREGCDEIAFAREEHHRQDVRREEREVAEVEKGE